MCGDVAFSVHPLLWCRSYWSCLHPSAEVVLPMQCFDLRSVNGQFPDILLTWPIIFPFSQTKWPVEKERILCQRVLAAMALQLPNGGCYWQRASISGSRSMTRNWTHRCGSSTPSSIVSTWTVWRASFVLDLKVSCKACVILMLPSSKTRKTYECWC
jgi:hypothetical protein